MILFYIGLISFAFALVGLTLATILTIVQLFRRNHQLLPGVKRLAIGAFTLHSISVVTLLVMLLSQDAQNAYVVSVIHEAMPTILKATALWGGQAGSLLFWSWTVHLVLFIALLRKKHALDAWGFIILALNTLMFSGLSFFAENPFRRVWLLQDGGFAEALFAPNATASLYGELSGFGLNPLLRHPGMVIHPPILYLGFALFLPPFAVAISKLLRGEGLDALLEKTRGWVLATWIFLTAGIALGSWWAYEVLGWGGYWAWDPVETASLLPWLTSTALLHSLFIEKHKRSFKRFNFALVLITWLMTLFAIFVTRTGLISSVHAFGESQISQPLGYFMLLSFLVSLYAFLTQWRELDSGWTFKSFFTRDALILYTNILLLGLMVICLYGLVYPMLSGVFSKTAVTFDRSFFDRTTTPLFMLLVVLTAICPVLGWSLKAFKARNQWLWTVLVFPLVLTILTFIFVTKKAIVLVLLFIIPLGIAVLIYQSVLDWKGCKSFWGQRARIGAWLVHAGLLLIALGVVGMAHFSDRIQGLMIPGDKMPLGNYTVEFIELRQDASNPEYTRVSAHLKLYEGERFIKELNPAQDIYHERNQWISIPSKRSTLRGDQYTRLLEYNASMGTATIQLIDNGLVNFLWIGSILMILGGALALSKPSTVLQMDKPYHGDEVEEEAVSEESNAA